ncbi:MAG: twin-arginine translocation signal domain-containing protein [Anaerolineales bacterium]
MSIKNQFSRRDFLKLAALSTGALYEDNVFPWIREAVGSMPGRINQRFVETPYGFVWGGYVQPMFNQLNTPITNLPQTSLGQGMWVEVTVPYVDLVLDNPPERAPWLQYRSPCH